MKHAKIKSILTLSLVALLLTIAVSGTLAYLVTSTQSVVNTFEPTQVSVTVTDEVDGWTKKDVVITNTSNVKAYIRMAIVANWQDENNIVIAGWNDFNGITPNSNWQRGSDGYYYYTLPVEPGAILQGDTAPFTAYTYAAEANGIPTDVYGTPADHLQMDILVQAIQAEPEDAVEDAWSVNVGENGILSLQ